MNPQSHTDPASQSGADVPNPDTAPVAASPAAKSEALTRTILWVLGFVALLALLIGAALWQKVAGMQEQLARQSADAQSQSLEARAMAKQAVTLAQDAAARAAVLDSRLSEVALQRSQLDELMQSMSRSRDENLVVDIDAALRLAQQQAQLTGSVEPLLAALKSADQRIVRAAQPRLALLQRAIARDIERVKSSAVSDTPPLLVKLDELVHLVDELVLANAVAPARQVEKNLVTPPQAAVSWWQSGLQMVIGEARNLVRVSRIESPEAALLSPEQSFFLRENLKLKLLNARLGLLARQIDSARSDLADADVMLKRYFQANARKNQAAGALLQQVQTQMRTLQLPRIDDTLAVLATAAAGR
jgi:uroporphyrin-III C-methyltransferase